MTFPRFNSGNVGRLSFEHLNELFDTVEKLKPLLSMRGGSAEVDLMLVARITGSTANGAHTWTEVVPKAATDGGAPFLWEERTGGAKSGAANDADYDPAFVIERFTWTGSNPTPTRLPNDSVVVLRKLRRKDGKQSWIVVNGVSSGGCWAARITVATLTAPAAGCGAQTVQQWLYDWEEVSRASATTMEWTAGGRTSATVGKARNGAERGCVSGVGGPPPANVTETNQAVAVGTVVSMSLDAAGRPFFSLTNDRAISCA
jgi:hypothetical protein